MVGSIYFIRPNTNPANKVPNVKYGNRHTSFSCTPEIDHPESQQKYWLHIQKLDQNTKPAPNKPNKQLLAV